MQNPKYKLTTDHPASSYGQPVLVDIETDQVYEQTDTLPDGTPASWIYEELSPPIKESYLGQTAHVNHEGRPLCNQTGDYLHLCEPDEFERLPGQCRCGRCERALGHRDYTNPLSDQQRQLLAEISKRTPGDSWVAVTDLCKVKTEAAVTSLHRSLRRMENRGLIERKTDSHNRAFVRLKGRGNSGGNYSLDVFVAGD